MDVSLPTVYNASLAYSSPLAMCFADDMKIAILIVWHQLSQWQLTSLSWFLNLQMFFPSLVQSLSHTPRADFP